MFMGKADMGHHVRIETEGVEAHNGGLELMRAKMRHLQP